MDEENDEGTREGQISRQREGEEQTIEMQLQRRREAEVKLSFFDRFSASAGYFLPLCHRQKIVSAPAKSKSFM